MPLSPPASDDNDVHRAAQRMAMGTDFTGLVVDAGPIRRAIGVLDAREVTPADPGVDADIAWSGDADLAAEESAAADSVAARLALGAVDVFDAPFGAFTLNRQAAVVAIIAAAVVDEAVRQGGAAEDGTPEIRAVGVGAEEIGA